MPLIDGGTQRLPRIVGMGRALEMILTGRLVEAPTALDWGLVTEVVEPGRHLDRALEIAEGLAAFPQETMLSDRRAALEGIGLPFEDGLALEAKLGRDSVITGAPGRRASPPARAAAPRAPASRFAQRPSRDAAPPATVVRASSASRDAVRHAPTLGPDPELGEQPLLGLALDLGDDLDVVGSAACRGASWPAGRRPGRCRRSCSSRSRSAPRARSPAEISTRSIAAAEIAWIPICPASTGSRVRPWAMSSASATRTTPASTV